MGETSKARERRIRERFFERYLVGKGIDICCGDDPVTPDCDRWDQEQGDAHCILGRGPYDWVYSSHGLEHMYDPLLALRCWTGLLKSGGRLIISVPHRDLYERKESLPSIWNEDHKTFWLPERPDLPATLGLSTCVRIAEPGMELLRLTVEDSGWRYLPPEEHAPGEYSIEGVWRKSAS